MIAVHAVSPENEMPVAERLRASIASAWPDVVEGKRDRIDILVGIRTPADVDILVIVDLDSPHALPAQLRRGGGSSAPVSVQYAFIAIEVKQLDVSRFARTGNQWFPVYGGATSQRSVSAQAHASALSVSTFACRSGYQPFVHSLAWLTEVDETMLKDIDPIVVGRETTWFGMLDAAMQQNPVLARTDVADAPLAARVIRERLLNRRKDSSRDRVRVDRLSRDLASRAAVDALVDEAGSAQIRLIGRGGSGKTTSLALLAVRLAEAGERVLILTFHHALRSDIAHLVAALSRPAGISAHQIHVETMVGFVLSGLTALGADIPMAGADPDYAKLEGAIAQTCGMLVGTPDSAEGDVAKLRAATPERFAWDHVFIDEAQDCTDGERDFLRALYGHRRLVLADGVDQLVRRQVPCDWHAGVPASERIVHRLDDSLRMLRNVATFANCFARALGRDTWRITPREDLPGGRIIIATGDVISPVLLQAIVRAAAQNKADAVDCLVCLPPSSREDACRKSLLAAAETAGIAVWDGTVADTRTSVAAALDSLRLVRYESCRGLEGWITLALDLDDLVDNKLRHPNLNSNDPEIAADVVAERWMLIPLTRAVHTLIVTVRDPDSRTAALLRDAMNDPAMPHHVVEWVTAETLAETLSPAPAAALPL